MYQYYRKNKQIGRSPGHIISPERQERDAIVHRLQQSYQRLVTTNDWLRRKQQNRKGRHYGL